MKKSLKDNWKLWAVITAAITGMITLIISVLSLTGNSKLAKMAESGGQGLTTEQTGGEFQMNAEECRVYASEGDELILYDLDRTAPALVRRSSVTLPASVQAACRNEANKCMYVASSAGGYLAIGEPREEHYLSAFRIEASGELTPLGNAVPLPYRPVYISLDPAGTHLLVAYSQPASVTVHTILADGRIGEQIEQPPIEMRNYAHQVVTSPQGDFIAVCCTGQDAENDPTKMRGAIHTFAYDNGVIGDVLQTVSPNDGIEFSPRHIDFHPTLPLAYVSLERQSELAVFSYGPHGLDPEPLYRVSTLLGGQSKGSQYAGTVRMHPSGRFVFITNRTLGFYEEDGKKILTKGGDDIAVFEINLTSGEPTMIQRIDAEGIMPRTMNTDTAGELLVVANQFTAEAYDGDVLRYVPQSLMIYRVAENGQLTRAWRHELARSQKPMIWMDVFPT